MFLLPCTSLCIGNRAELRARVPSVTRTIVKTRCRVTFHNVFIYGTRNEDLFIFVCTIDDFCSQEHELYELLYLPEFFCYLLLSQAPNLCSRLCTNTTYKAISVFVANRSTTVMRPPRLILGLHLWVQPHLAVHVAVTDPLDYGGRTDSG